MLLHGANIHGESASKPSGRRTAAPLSTRSDAATARMPAATGAAARGGAWQDRERDWLRRLGIFHLLPAVDPWLWPRGVSTAAQSKKGAEGGDGGARSWRRAETAYCAV